MDQETKLKYLENKINKILDNKVSTQHNIMHPSLLTLEELEMYKVDFFKLKLLRTGIIEYKNKYLIFAIKIPIDYIKTGVQLIKAIPNKEYFEIKEKDVFIVNVNNQIFIYEKNLMLKELKLSEHCFIKKTCKIRYNNLTSIEEIDEETIIVKNIFNKILGQNCDKRQFSLNGQYIINFNNCSLKINHREFKNSKTAFLDKYYYPTENIKNSSLMLIKPINLEKIEFENIKNIKEIKELKFHKNLLHGTKISVITILIIVVCIICYFKFKLRSKKIVVTNKMIPEDSDLKREGVIYADVAKTSLEPSVHQVVPPNLKLRAW